MSYLRGTQEGWAQARVAYWPMRAGVRESRRWKGRVCLTGEAILDGKRGEDDVAKATWPLELRETHRGPKLRFPREGRYAGIPAGALQAAEFEQLFVAGRCLSCDHEAQASIRVMGTCFATGEAAARLAVAGRL
ncbi:MAG: FAD-dependent oxidoreductase [Verrucomicrobiales bacterium]